MMMLELVFWCLWAVLFYVYLGYPCLLWVFAKLRPRTVRRANMEPKVSIVIAAYNEELCIGLTIENKLRLDYPAEKLEIIVVSDGSSDRTDEIVRGFEQQGVTLMVQSPRQGKTAALNVAAKKAAGELLVFADANSMYHPLAVRKLVRNFADPTVGYVSGRMAHVDPAGSLVGGGCTAYMRYENMLRSLETQVGSIIGVNGGVDAMRRSLFREMSADMLPDFVLPMHVIEKGSRVVYESEAVVEEATLSTEADEWQMRVRVSLRGLRAIWAMRALLNPWRHPLTAFQLVSHKLLRYMAGVFQIALVALNIALIGYAVQFRVILIIQLAFYLLGIIGLTYSSSVNRYVFLKYPAYLCLLNAAAVVAVCKWITGNTQVTWSPRRG